MIMDAKFKPKWETVLGYNTTSIGDVLSDYDKCLRDMVDIGGFATGVIFPTNTEIKSIESIVSHKISVYNNVCRFYTLPIFIPYSENNEEQSKELSYPEWNNKLKESVHISMDIVGKALKYEKSYFEAISETYMELQELRNNENKSPFEQ